MRKPPRETKPELSALPFCSSPARTHHRKRLKVSRQETMQSAYRLRCKRYNVMDVSEKRLCTICPAQTYEYDVLCVFFFLLGLVCVSMICVSFNPPSAPLSIQRAPRLARTITIHRYRCWCTLRAHFSQDTWPLHETSIAHNKYTSDCDKPHSNKSNNVVQSVVQPVDGS